ncbi:hypothetical protein [Sinomicrobium soli]|uniref:hypothetical protein n=1 Tax=Sinomicrobium sp. N-1-3-6 TaxID=2219864 RepID=UPI000DCE61A0|nr:hypothetical protein [Sinomicrobium sp. N-1-3-6]RAV29151.1 hypothetical protein DN748_09525 [Sinomicrobium sp. N-1-3-6]
MKYLAVIMAVLCLVLSSVPCCVFTDNCREDNTHQDCNGTHEAPDDHSCAACSPFFTCSTCPGFVLQSSDYEFPAGDTIPGKKIVFYLAGTYSAFFATLFKPPRM